MKRNFRGTSIHNYAIIAILICIILDFLCVSSLAIAANSNPIDLMYNSTPTRFTIQEALDIQMTKSPKSYGDLNKIANKEEIAYYMNPGNFLDFIPTYNFQEEETIRITANTLNVRLGPGTSYDIIDTVKQDDTYTVLTISNGWYKIEVKSKVGWVSGDYTQVVEPNRNENVKFNAVKITASSLNVRKGADASYDKVAVVKKDEIYVVLDKSGGWYKIQTNGGIGWISASYAEYTNNVPRGMYQFLVLSGSYNVPVADLNKELLGKGILQGLGQAFIDASKEYNINEVYLLYHALLETGYGKSVLANGILVNEVDGKKVEPKIAYNMFGIGAYDNSPIKSGSEYAYKKGWFTPRDAILGGGEWIAKNYINHVIYKQDTLYKMRWNPLDPGVHQYATDVGWAYKQTYNMDLFFEICERLEGVSLVFDIPIYKGGNYLDIENVENPDKITGWHEENSIWYYYDDKNEPVIGTYTIDNKIQVFSSEGIWLGTWIKDAKGWWFKYCNKTYPTSIWVRLDKKWYYFDNDGYMVTGWRRLDGKWYYMNKSGAMAVGWKRLNTGWYYLNSDGTMAIGWKDVKDKRYYLSDSGVMETGWIRVGKVWYHMDESGAMKTGWIKSSGKWYYLNSSGAMEIGWTRVGKTWYYMNSSGAMQIGWIKSDNNWYYLDGSGAMKIGWTKVGENWYYMNGSGAMQTGWLLSGGKWYYLRNDGSMAFSTVIDGYKIDKNGAWVK